MNEDLSLEKKKKFIKYFIISLFTIVVFLILFVIVVGVISFVLKVRTSYVENRGRKSFTYENYRINPETNLAKAGFVTLPVEMKEGEFISYQDEVGNHVLISNFGVEKYRCSGTCHCEEGERRVAISAFRGLFYLVVAGSSLLAYDLAKKQFEKECLKMNENTCSSTDISAEVDDCKIIDDDEEEEDDDLDSYEVYYDANKKKTVNADTMCKGECIPRTWITDDSGCFGHDQDVARKFFEMDHPDKSQMLKRLVEHSKGYGCDKMVLENVYKGKQKDAAMVEFKKALGIFCDDNTIVELKEDEVGAVFQECDLFCEPFPLTPKGIIKANLCTGTFNGGQNPTIQCVENIIK